MPFSEEKIREIENYRPKLMRFISHLTRDKSEIEDITQDTYVRILRAGENGRAPIDHVPSFMQRTARNLFLNIRRDRKPETVSTYVPADEDDYYNTMSRLPRASLDDKDRIRLQEIFAAVETLPPSRRRDFQLHFIEGFSAEEMSHRTGGKCVTYRARLSHLRSEIRDLINPKP